MKTRPMGYLSRESHNMASSSKQKNSSRKCCAAALCNNRSDNRRDIIFHNFPLDDNIIFSNFVLHWIKNIEDKKTAFENMFRSLKPTGKNFVRYGDRMPAHFDRVFRELNPENLDCLMSINQFEPRPVIEQMCVAAGFRVLKSFDEEFEDRVFENGDSLCLFFWATTNGVSTVCF